MTVVMKTAWIWGLYPGFKCCEPSPTVYLWISSGISIFVGLSLLKAGFPNESCHLTKLNGKCPGEVWDGGPWRRGQEGPVRQHLELTGRCAVGKCGKRTLK